MPISFSNNWKFILDKLENVLKSEFKGALPVYRGKEVSAGNQYLRLNPMGSDLDGYNLSSETRSYSIEITYHFRDPNIKKPALEHIFRQVSRVEALIHDNITMTLSDTNATNIFDCELSTCDLDVGDNDAEYVVSWDFSCMHQGNIS
tara:strand:- start:1906 stop:2346 length:441 start_codon:yes stop_codon:yes gene_type:complete